MKTITEKDLMKEAGQIVNYLALYNKELYNAGLMHGVQGWFKAYISSKEFAELDPWKKQEAFESYEGLKFVLEQIQDHDLVEVNNHINAEIDYLKL